MERQTADDPAAGSGDRPAARIERSMRRLSYPYNVFLFAGLMAAVLLVGVADFLTGAEYAFSIFYLVPIGVAALLIGLESGIALSIESAFTWYFADILARTSPYASAFIPAWNSGVRLATFLTVAILIHVLRNMYERESLVARIDYLTGAANARSFFETMEKQNALTARHRGTFTVLYLDVDNLKELNDSRGHPAGDKMLQATVSTLRRTLRPSDTVARLGGDEFAVLLPDADARAAGIVSERVQSALRKNPGKPFHVTFSIGALVCASPPKSVDELIEKADNLMYEAKRSGKDTVKISACSGDGQPAASS
jgi:diguanylate cyclase (GGDEF)-like protein